MPKDLDLDREPSECAQMPDDQDLDPGDQRRIEPYHPADIEDRTQKVLVELVRMGFHPDVIKAYDQICRSEKIMNELINNADEDDAAEARELFDWCRECCEALEKITEPCRPAPHLLET